MIDPAHVSACFITKDALYPKTILDAVHPVGFGEILILTNCDSPHRKQELFTKARYGLLYYQDDDCLAPIQELLSQADPHMITCAMKLFHLQAYQHSRIALLGWGSIFPRHFTGALDTYRAKYGEDLIYKRETERIMTALNYPQKRLALPIVDLPSAFAADRLSMQPGHYDLIPIVEQRCASL